MEDASDRRKVEDARTVNTERGFEEVSFTARHSAHASWVVSS